MASHRLLGAVSGRSGGRGYQVEDLLGHADPRTTARYARVVDTARANPAAAVPIRL